MKKNVFNSGLLASIAFSLTSVASAQLLYTPSGTVGSSSSGNVGIGTSGPSARLQVQGTGTGTAKAFSILDASGSERVFIEDGGTVSTAGKLSARGGIDLNTSFGGIHSGKISGAKIIESTSGSGMWLNATAGGVQINGTYLGFYNHSSELLFACSEWEDTCMFDVRSVGSEGDTMLRFTVKDGGSVELGAFCDNGPGAHIRFKNHRPDGFMNESLTIFPSGNIGVGVENPANKFEVNGSIRAKEVIVETTGWSDYVFAPEYSLSPLSEVEAHIKAKGHLPGIPSAADVEKNGIGVGEMQAKLLAKVEELTLHMIRLEKENEQLRREVGELRQGK